ncbi:NAD(P)-dependent oxidoreductase [Tessaracoccus caeni]|uniref:NAD(P)-dependent oxidoreductase n=1 Tax=Tessaracoccus caeni TaxID=3031239 RepID=UPI0023DCC774|nr:NAD(P)H-binding protein [Tessaracoccus caeni]MDF1487943.1 NAD(P)H-binding protein [Tessaracoccus caeni]
MKIIIIGGHGKVALLAAPLLVGAGHEVDAVIRNPAHIEDVAETGAHPVVADVEVLDVDQLAELVREHDAVVWSAGAGGGNAARTYAVDRDAAIRTMTAAERAGVKRFVMVSYFGAGRDHGVDPSDSFFAYAEAKAAADEHLRGTELDWTVLGPSRLTLGEATGRIGLHNDKGEVSRGNVALTIVQALADDTTIGRTIEYNDGDTAIAEALRGAESAPV